MLRLRCRCGLSAARPVALVFFLLRVTILLHASERNTAAVVKGSTTPLAAPAPPSSSSRVNTNQDTAVPIPTEDELMVDFSFSHIGPGGLLPDLPTYLAKTQAQQGNPLMVGLPSDQSPTADSPQDNSSSACIDEATTATTTATSTETAAQMAEATHQPRSPLGPSADVAAAPLALSLRECSLGDTGVAEVARSAWVCGTMGAVALSLRHNQVTSTGVRALLDSLRSSPTDRLSCLQLDFNPLGDAGAQPFPAYLKERAARGGGGLEELSLRFCDVGPAGCRYLSSALVKSAASVATEGTTAPPAPPAAAGAEKAAPPAAGIRKLLLTGNRLGDAGARALASALRKDRSLEVLDLTRCNIGDDGARCLADALRSNTCLRELRLGYNDISFDGASSLASLLHAGPGTLQALELEGNRVGDAGAVALAQGLSRFGGASSNDGSSSGGGRKKRNPRQTAARTKVERRGPGLRRLNLAGNGIGCIGGCALAKAVRGTGEKMALEELELAGNALTLSSAEASEAKKNSSLYKSAGGALSSILNQFVDESYYRSDEAAAAAATAAATASGISGGRKEALRCGVAALGNALRSDACSLRALGLGRTGITNKDASKLAAALRSRRVDSPLEEVEVGMNGLEVRTAEAVRFALESPTGSVDRDDGDGSEFGVGRRRQGRGRGRGLGRRSQGRERGDTARSLSASRERGAERAERGEVGEYAPAGGNVELELFGRKVASFHQPRGARTGLDVQVFGKRVRLDRSPPSRSSPSARGGTASPSSCDSDGWDTEDDSASSSSANDGYGSESDDSADSDSNTVDRDGRGYRSGGSSGDSEGSDTGTWDEDDEDDEDEAESEEEEEEAEEEAEEEEEEEENEDEEGGGDEEEEEGSRGGNDPSDEDHDGEETGDDTDDRGNNNGRRSVGGGGASDGKNTDKGDDVRRADTAVGEDSQTVKAAADAAGGRSNRRKPSRDVDTAPPVPRRQDQRTGDIDDGEWSAGFEPSEDNDDNDDVARGGSAEAEWVAGFGKSATGSAAAAEGARREGSVEPAAGDESSTEEGEDVGFSDVATDGDGDSWEHRR